MTKPCSFCITIKGYIEHSSGQLITVVTPSELNIPVWLRHKGARILPKVPKASLRAPAMDGSAVLTQLMGGGRSHHQALPTAELGISGKGALPLPTGVFSEKESHH